MLTKQRCFGLKSGNPSLREELLEENVRMNQDLDVSNYRRNIDEVNISTVSRTFGLGSRNANLGLTAPNNRSLPQEARRFSGRMLMKPRYFGLKSGNPSLREKLLEENTRMNQDSDVSNYRRNIDEVNVSTVSRTFGLGSRNTSIGSGLTEQCNGRSTQDIRSLNENRIMSVIPRPFGLNSRNSALSEGLSGENMRLNQGSDVTNHRRNHDYVNMSTDAGAFRLGSRSTNFGSDLLRQNNGKLTQDARSLNNNGGMSMTSRPFGLHTRGLTLHSDLFLEGNSRFQDSNVSNYKNSEQINMSSISRTFGPGGRNITLNAGLQESMRYNYDSIDDEGFRKPSLSRVIRGRNSTMSSRLFSNQNVDKYSKDLSNINGLNVTHISKRGMDTMSESRLALRHNWMDNHSVAGSVLSTASMKAQFINLLENLHHSILNIGPHVTAEAVRIEFDKAKQGLDNISEMSFAPTIRETDSASVISHSLKYNCPQIPDQTAISVFDGGSLNLKSSTDILKTLVTNKGRTKKVDQSVNESRNKSPHKQSSHSKLTLEDDGALVFTKPKPYSRKRNSKMLKIKTPQVSKSIASKITGKIINLKQWYPIVVGSDLAICGVDEEGAVVETEPIKKRVNSRKLELVNGLSCNLIGSPSSVVSDLPKKIMNLLKNGLTDRWRMLQKELASCQIPEKEVQKSLNKSSVAKTVAKKAVKTVVRNSPQKIVKASAVHTRSGRTVKPPSLFWIAWGSEEVSSSVAVSTPERSGSEKAVLRTPTKKTRKETEESPAKKTRKVYSPKKLRTVNEDSPVRKIKTGSLSTPKRRKEASSASPVKTSKGKNNEASITKKTSKSSKVTSHQKSSIKNKKVEDEVQEEMVKVHSSTEESRQLDKTKKSPANRKRKLTADTNSVRRKRSKLDKKIEVEAESTVEETRPRSKAKRKQTTTKLVVNPRSPKTKLKKSAHTKKGKGVSRKKTVTVESEYKSEMREANEFEEDFHLQLDDIEVPEIANVSGNPQLTRSQLRLVSMETPPLKYFNSNLKIMSNTTPVRSPNWCISQRTESEVKQFQRRREEAFKKRIKMVEVKKTIKGKTESVTQNRDLRKVLDWVAEERVRSPQWNSKVLQYVIPSRRQMERDDDDNDEEEEDIVTEFL